MPEASASRADKIIALCRQERVLTPFRPHANGVAIQVAGAAHADAAVLAVNSWI
jgi:hypothetical protein